MEPQAGEGLPEIVVAPARPDTRPGHDGDTVFEVRRMSDGDLALPVFSTVGRLVRALGNQQPWVALPLRNLQRIMGTAGVNRVVLDPGAEPGAWRWREEDTETLRSRLP
jgi:hypothetical protein